MPWRLPGPIRSFPGISARRKYTSAAKSAPPLRILFCGSDDFSIASLRALSKARRDTPDLIASIDVVHRPPKPTGRGLKTLHPVPIQHVATEELHLSTHVIDTFTGWAPPAPIDLIVAVSFGLRVPPRILGLAKYGGLNVHASLLPDLRGPAPVHHALLKEREHTGVSVQTLHPMHFDRGLVLAQTAAPGIRIAQDTTPRELTQTLARDGAEMLVDVLRSGAFVPPLQEGGWYAGSGGPEDHAPKLSKDQQHVDFRRDGVREVLKIWRVLGPPYCLLPNGCRLIMDEVGDSGFPVAEKGHVSFAVDESNDSLLVRLGSGETLRVIKSTYEGGKTGHGNSRVIRLIQSGQL